MLCQPDAMPCLQIKSESILTDGVLRHIWDLLEEHAIPEQSEVMRINYDHFTQVHGCGEPAPTSSCRCT